MNPLLQNNQPFAQALVSDTGGGANVALAGVVFSTAIVPRGTNQLTATSCLPGRNVVLAATAGTGLLATPIYGSVQEILNLSNIAILLYPPLGAHFYGQQPNTPNLIPAVNTISEVFTTDGIVYFLLNYPLSSLISYPTSDANLPVNSLWNNGGFLCITPPTSSIYPQSTQGLITGTLWNNGGFICIAP